MQYISSIFCFVFLCLHSTCQKPEHPHPPRTWPDPGLQDLSVEWPIAEPVIYDISNSLVSSVLDNGSSISGLQSIVVVKNGTLVGERYFQDGRETLRHIRSCTKSVVSLLTGIAIDAFIAGGLHQPIGEVIVPSLTPSLDSATSSITIHDLLTMSSGFQWNESDFSNWFNAPDQINYILQSPLSDIPGTRFNYSSPAVHLLGAIVSLSAGMELSTMARQQLFTPLGITAFEWDKDHQGNTNGATGLQLRTRDMAKIGYLMIQRGHSGQTQLIPETYVSVAGTNSRSGEGVMGGFTQLGYGYLWWTDSSQHEEAIIAWGYGGQFIYIVPAQYLVIAATADWIVDGERDKLQSQAISRYIVDEVFQAVQ